MGAQSTAKSRDQLVLVLMVDRLDRNVDDMVVDEEVVVVEELDDVIAIA